MATGPSTMNPPRIWDVFCRVIDNFGDIGTCWRLACNLAARGAAVRLWADDLSALEWMAPGGARGVSTVSWVADAPDLEPGEVVIEAFGCDPPARFVRRMAARQAPPVWINLEYLSAEAYVERCHGLASPQSNGPGAGLEKWFFYPGFSRATGGLLREADLAERQSRFDASCWLGAQGIERRADERVVSLFCYDAPALAAFCETWAQRPTLLLVAAGTAEARIDALSEAIRTRGALRVTRLPRLSQVDFDHLLWTSDLNIVRGEDSFVRAQWAGVPFVWQAYPQGDGAHALKLEAFLDRFLDRAVAGGGERCPESGPAAGIGSPVEATAHPIDADLRALWRGWNGLAAPTTAEPDRAVWQRRCAAWRHRLMAQPDLCTQLMAFAAARRAAGGTKTGRG